MDIVWSCFVTMFACSWTVTHTDIHHKKSLYSPKVIDCILAIIAPEVLASSALADYLETWDCVRSFNAMGKERWTMTQAFFVKMGGSKVDFENCTETLGADELDTAMDDLHRAFRKDILNMKSTPVEDIGKRAKTNHIVKALICLQASWLVAQVIGRAVARFPITTLKVVTVGYVVCALITYTCWWHKPQDAEVPIIVKCRGLTKEEFYRQISKVRLQPFEMREWRFITVCVINGIFGAVHCTAWRFFFPTIAEGVMWKVASVITTITPIAITGGLRWVYEYWDWIMIFPAVLYMMLFPALLYIPLRLYLMVESFVAFRSVPVGIFYTVNWASWIPHI